MSTLDLQKGQKVIAGPHTLFEDSIKVEFLQDESLDATFLIRMTVTDGHPLIKKGKHPLTPPLHLHFDQAETFKVLRGKWGLTAGYEQRDIILTPSDEPYTIPTWLPHFPWPVPTDEDSVILAWGHPSGVPKPMDVPFFEQIFLYTGNCFAEKKQPDLLQMMLNQNETNSTMVIFPGWTFLGPLRWWIPWKLQGAVATLAKLCGYSTTYMPKYLKKGN